jgi:hypothetical protein
MSSFSQRILNLFQKCTKKIIPYALSLAASRKDHSYAGIARTLETNYHSLFIKISEIDINIDQIMQRLISKVQKYQTTCNRGWIIVDFTRLAKSKDAKTPLTTWDRDGRINVVNNGFSAGFCVWTNGSITIPLSFSFWLNRKDSGDSFVSKKVLAKNMISSIVQKLGNLEVIVDGEFATLEMLEFFSSQNINFTARIACNRKATSMHGIVAQLKFHQGLHLNKNQKSRTMAAYLNGKAYEFTSVKQKTRNGKKKIVFIISTNVRSSKEHVRIYSLRWNIEKFFRTSKQSLGLEACQAQKSHGIVTRILAVILIFTALEETKLFLKEKSVEAVLHVLRSKNSLDSPLEYSDLVETYVSF